MSAVLRFINGTNNDMASPSSGNIHLVGSQQCQTLASHSFSLRNQFNLCPKTQEKALFVVIFAMSQSLLTASYKA